MHERFHRDPTLWFARDARNSRMVILFGNSATHFRTFVASQRKPRGPCAAPLHRCTTAMSVRRAAAHLPSRSVHLRIVPRPANLSESREIFRVLQRFGEINTYKHLRVRLRLPAALPALLTPTPVRIPQPRRQCRAGHLPHPRSRAEGPQCLTAALLARARNIHRTHLGQRRPRSLPVNPPPRDLCARHV